MTSGTSVSQAARASPVSAAGPRWKTLESVHRNNRMTGAHPRRRPSPPCRGRHSRFNKPRGGRLAQSRLSEGRLERRRYQDEHDPVRGSRARAYLRRDRWEVQADSRKNSPPSFTRKIRSVESVHPMRLDNERTTMSMCHAALALKTRV